ncbi:sensor histidine kinase [Roseicyclus mahoneyensis]|uniref:histidine kinase n=1 Tax=Roseicyclus mahoneyensis TaxID=164332 RepID=A0A316GE28_9RHOB|nr:HAMP domain-containing sensor histidine kinase [Roseicyclus mahoneyensis]PWK58186.1 signal transduction histidine kinase [Roseicyclus mahoneyensis]
MGALTGQGLRHGRVLPRLPLTLRVPVVVAGLMIFVSLVVSERAISQFDASQARHFVELGNAYLDGMAPAVVPAVVREDVWEVFDVLDRSRELYRGLELIQTVVTDPDGRVIAASDPRQTPVGSLFEAGVNSAAADDLPRLEPGTEVASLRRDLLHRGHAVGTLHARIDVGPLQAERQRLLWMLIIGNAAITLGLSALGYLAVTQMVRPLRLISSRLASGSTLPVPEDEMPSDLETARLYEGYNRLIAALESRERLSSRLAEKERLAALGQLATGMAHEINNPLGGLITALDTLDHHGDRPEVRQQTIALLRRGLDDIGRVVRTTLAGHRGATDPRPLAPGDLEDLRTLIAPELRLRGQSLDWDVGFETPLPVPAGPLRQALLNLLLNASNAAPRGATIGFRALPDAGRLVLSVEDAGPGLPEALRDYLVSGGTGEAPLRSGPHLGLWLIRTVANEIGARIEVAQSALGGARVSLLVPLPRTGGADGL